MAKKRRTLDPADFVNISHTEEVLEEILVTYDENEDVVIKATKVKGVYTADPVHDPSAEFIPTITFQVVVTRELGVMDTPAVSLCKENDLPIIVLNLEDRGAVTAAIRGERVGTLVS